jgi:nucleotide-binding universal stress UspA family protein
MSSLVVGYDGSPAGEAALEQALALAGQLGDGVIVVFGYAPPGLWGGEIAEHEEAIEEFGQKVTAQARSQAAARGTEIEVELVARHPVEALMKVAAERQARAIVVGSTGESQLKGMILGSTPNKLLHLTDRPVLVVPANE